MQARLCPQQVRSCNQQNHYKLDIKALCRSECILTAALSYKPLKTYSRLILYSFSKVQG